MEPNEDVQANALRIEQASALTIAAMAPAVALIEAGLTKLDADLPEKCSEETREKVGEVISRTKRVGRFIEDTLKAITAPWNKGLKAQREQWAGVATRADELERKALALVDALLDEEKRKREEAEAEARRKVAETQRLQSEAEARALAAETPEAAAAAAGEAEQLWNQTRQTVAQLDAVPVQTSIKIGGVTAYESSRLAFEVTDMGAFAKAHPDLVEVCKGPTITALRAALASYNELPETVPGFPGLRVFMSKKRSAR